MLDGRVGAHAARIYFEKARFDTPKQWCCEAHQVMDYSDVRDYSECRNPRST
jgi:hypothetical protein